MNPILLTLVGSTVGKRCVMALTGLGLLGFLLFHVYGNLYIYLGRNRFDTYADRLHGLPFLPVVETGLLALAATHVVFGAILTLQNGRARPIPYTAKRPLRGRTTPSSTMIYSGLAVLAFAAFHVWGIRAGQIDGGEYDVTASILTNRGSAACYVLGALALTFHLYHGASSAAQSLGLTCRKYDRLIMVLGRAGALAVAAGLVSIPVMFLGGGFPK